MPQYHISMEIQAPFHHVTSQARRRGPVQRVGPYMMHWNAHECASCICARLLEFSNRLYHLCWRLTCLCQVRPSCDKHSMVSKKPLGSGRGFCRVRLSGSIILKVCPVSANTQWRDLNRFFPDPGASPTPSVYTMLCVEGNHSPNGMASSMVSCESILVGLYMSKFNDLLVLVFVGVSLHNAAQIVLTFWTALLCSSLQHHCIRKYSAPPPTLGLLHRICLCCMSEVSGFWLKAT